MSFLWYFAVVPVGTDTRTGDVMKYTTTELRRQDRAMGEAEARRLLAEGEVAVLAMQQPDGGAYAVPLNYVWDGESSIYMHCAPEGHKLDCLAACAQVCLVITGSVEVLPQLFSTAYESLVIQGEVAVVESAEEKLRALHLLLQKYTPEHLPTGQAYAARAAEQTLVLRLVISSWSGKKHRRSTKVDFRSTK